ncbi:HupE/UreJ family protein [Erythrobacter ani]|uniref:HupE/UreJ family protein n=1 Tax=Erythrobacter ani TaxID=2827235 RepID=A0ABS6SMR7_9SPHN|nr:HupE/UreJ family protein [Erythrobacter ani]MBV7265929.1 HupE/UreJ family protein [Erythrobacter ani]
MTRCELALLSVILAVFAAPLSADDLRPAVLELSQTGPNHWSLEWTVPVAPGASGTAFPIAGPVIPENCELVGGPVRRAAPLALMGHAQMQCRHPMAGKSFGLTGLIGNADAIARYVPLDGPVQSFRLTHAASVAVIASQPDSWAVARDYFVIGAEHILFGWDHLLFVIALVFLVRKGWAVVKAATAFTIAHSITLVATTFGYTGLPSRPVEALIALSIVFLAVEVMRALRKPDRRTWTRRVPWLVAFGFGLLHGFGFAGALAEIGLPQTEIASALIAFNLGVEAGQLLVIAALMVLLSAMRRLAPMAETPAIRVATYGIGITGSFWLFERIVG